MLKLSTEVEPPKDGLSWLNTLKEKLRPRIIRYTAAGMALLLAGGLGYSYLTKPNAYAVMVDGKEIGFIAEDVETDKILAEIYSQKGEAGTIRCLEEISRRKT